MPKTPTCKLYSTSFTSFRVADADQALCRSARERIEAQLAFGRVAADLNIKCSFVLCLP
jgi:hypothetical protein